jgi:protein SDA1
MKKKQRISSDRNNNIYYSPLNNLIDPQVCEFLYHHRYVSILLYQINIFIPCDLQGFVEKLFARLQKCNERFEVRILINTKPAILYIVVNEDF